MKSLYSKLSIIKTEEDFFSNYYMKDDSPETKKYLQLMGGAAHFITKGSSYYNAVPCEDLQTLINKTIDFNKYSGGTAAVTITEVQQAKKRSRRGNKTKWI